MSFLKKFRRLLWAGAPKAHNLDASHVFDSYVDVTPSPQNLIDLIPGWNHALPEFTGATAGPHPFYADPRIIWAVEKFGSIEGASVLELGPLEASHTYLLSQFAPRRILAIEANRLAFLKCLIVKEILKLRNAEFILGDCQKWFDQSDERFDFIVACGILYHMRDPVHLLASMSAHTDALMIWTHYFDEAEMPDGDPRRTPFSGAVLTQDFQDVSVTLHQRGYYEAQRDQKFCGGLQDTHYWMERSDILAILQRCGFDDIRMSHEEPNHPAGPAFSVFARRTSP